VSHVQGYLTPPNIQSFNGLDSGRQALGIDVGGTEATTQVRTASLYAADRLQQEEGVLVDAPLGLQAVPVGTLQAVPRHEPTP
jgi:hypothetical protein